MQADSPSQTAMATAWLRALHRVADDAPLVFDDPWAVRFLPPAQQRFLARLGDLPRAWRTTFRLRRSGLSGMRAQVLVRARYTEDALDAARRAGADRYVVLAAGLDTFALRQTEQDDPLPVLELDHPATQRWKRAAVDGLDAAPPRLEYRAVDFERQSLADVLPASQAPQFISWLGTTYSLTRLAVTATLPRLADASAPGSRLVMDYWREAPRPGADAALLWGTRIATALQAEPMRSFFEPGDMERLVRDSGWHVREHCAPLIQDQRYLQRRDDGLAVPSFAFLLQLER